MSEERVKELIEERIREVTSKENIDRQWENSEHKIKEFIDEVLVERGLIKKEGWG